MAMQSCYIYITTTILNDFYIYCVISLIIITNDSTITD